MNTTEQTHPKKGYGTALKFGLYSGAIVAILMGISAIFFDKMSYDTAEVFGFTSMFIALSLIYFGIREDRKKQAQNAYTFKRAFLTGLYISLIASAIYVAGWMLICLIKPEVMEQVMIMYGDKLKESAANPEELAIQTENFETFKASYDNSFFRMGMTFLEIFPIALIITLVSALILRKKA